MKTKQFFLLAALGLMVTATLTSCEDVLGHWEKPTPAEVTPAASVAVTSITLDPTTLDKKVGDAAVTLTATVLPADATDKSLTWSSSDEAVATVDDGVVSALSAGTATITATAKDGSGVIATCTVTVGIPGLLAPGLLAGKLTINASNDQVQFSQSNLRYVSGAWSFFDNQYDYYTTYDADAWDKFGWVGESSTALTTDPAKYGISNSTTTSDYGTSTGDALKSDWGTNMGTGWRTLTGDEWKYLFSTRTTGGTVFETASARYAHATINTNGTPVNGIILFPDGVDIANSEVTTAGAVNANSGWGTKCTSAQWAALAAKGCVFLPAAGYRYGSAFFNAGTKGLYWSSSPYASDPLYACCVDFTSGYLYPATNFDLYYRGNGFSVRLVRVAE